MRYYLIGDTHLGHDMLIERCGRPDDFSDRILTGLASISRYDNVLIHLGDICMKREVYWQDRIRQATTARKWLILGNHDKKSHSWYLDHGWDFVCDSMMLHMFGHKILFSHVPQAMSGYTINIHGHFHDNDHGHWEPELVAIHNDRQALFTPEHTNYLPVELGGFIERWTKMRIPARWWEYHDSSCEPDGKCNDRLCPKKVYEKTGKWIGPKKEQIIKWKKSHLLKGL